MPRPRRSLRQNPSHALGAAVRARRLELGLSQEGLASAAGFDRTYVGGVERGERNPTLRVIWTLATILDIRASELLRLAEELIGE